MEQENSDSKIKRFNKYEEHFYNMQGYKPVEKSLSKKQKLEAFKVRLEAFNDVFTLKDAKALLNKIMPVQLERTVFFIGDGKCTIINKTNLLKISLQTPNEFITYNFI